MPVTTDFNYRLSGGASNSAPLNSLGGVKSSNSAGATIFDRVDATEAAAGDIEYRCLYVHNASATVTYLNVTLWILADTPEASTIIELGLGTSATNGTEQTVGAEGTAPTGVTFAAAASKGAGVALGTLAPGESRAVWLRRTVTAATGAVSTAFSLRTEGENS